MLALDLLDRLRRGTHARRRDRLEERLGDRLLEPQATDRLAGVIAAVQLVGADAGIARDAAARARIGDLHPPAALAAAHDPLQQRAALAGGTAGFAGADHVGAQALARGEVVGPGDIARMVLGDADRPLLERQLDRPAPDAPASVEVLLLAGPAEHESARIGRVGEQVVDRAIARARPAHAPLADRAARQELALGDQLTHELARRAEPPPELKDAFDRVPDLLVGRQHDPPVVGALEPDRQVLAELAALGLVAQPAVEAGADQVQLGLRHRPLEPEQEPVVEVLRRIDPVRVGDQRRGQGAEVEQLVPVGRRARQARDLEREHQPDLPQPDLGDELLEAEPALARGARAAEVVVDDRARGGRPAELERALPERVLAGARLVVARELGRRRLAHVDDRPPAPVRIGDPRAVTHRARPPPGARAAAPAAVSPRAGARPAASPRPPLPPPSPRRSPAPAVPTSPPP